MQLALVIFSINVVQVEVANLALLASMVVSMVVRQTMSKVSNKEATRKVMLYTKVSMVKKEVVNEVVVIILALMLAQMIACPSTLLTLFLLLINFLLSRLSLLGFTKCHLFFSFYKLEAFCMNFPNVLILNPLSKNDRVPWMFLRRILIACHS